MKSFLKWASITLGGFAGGYTLLLLAIGGPSLVSTRFHELTHHKPKRLSEQLDSEWTEEIRVKNKKARLQRQFEKEADEYKDSLKRAAEERAASGSSLSQGLPPPGVSGEANPDAVNQQVMQMYGVAPGMKPEDKPEAPQEKEDKDSPWENE